MGGSKPYYSFGFGKNCVCWIPESIVFPARFLVFSRFCHCKRNANTQKYAQFDEKTKKTIIREQKARQNRKLIPGSPRIDGQLRPIHIGRSFFIDIPMVSVAWGGPNLTIPLVSVRIAFAEFLKVLYFLHVSLYFHVFAIVNVTRTLKNKPKLMRKPRKPLYVSKKHAKTGN